jgi:hypothetical protein
VAWTTQFPETLVLPLARTTSNHLPCKIQIGTNIPKANIFRFENYWFNHPTCLEHIANAWLTPFQDSNNARCIGAKFKLLRRVLKLWSKNILNLKILISNCNLTIAFFDKLEEIRRLYPQESKFRTLIKDHIRNLLAMQKEYWR